MTLENHQKIFISYSKDDNEWVRTQLLPRLEEKKIEFMDRTDFRGGFLILDEIERSMKACQRTILVITPNYLKDTWASHNAGLVMSYGINTEQWLAIPVIATACTELPERIKALVCIDLSSEDRPEWDQLFEAVQTPPKQILIEDFADIKRPNAPPPGGGPPAISKGLKALCELMARPEVKDEVTRFRERFEKACSQIQVLADYKDVHDELHLTQRGCLQPLLDAQEGFPDKDRARENVLDSQYELQRSVESIEEVMGRPTFANGGHFWPRNLQMALTFLTAANQMVANADQHDERERRISSLGEAILNLNLVIAKQPSRFNDFLREAARDLKLADLILALTSIGGHLTEIGQEREKVKRFETAIENLADLYRKLKVLLADHDKWQEIDLMLHEMKNNLDMSKLKAYWKFLPEAMEPMYAGRTERWARQFQELGCSLDDAILGDEFELAKEPFQRYYSLSGDRFIRVDKAIKNLCGDLREVGASLSLILEIIQ